MLAARVFKFIREGIMVHVSVSRRELLAGIAGLPAVLAAKSAYKPKLSVQTYVWTQVLSEQKRTLADGLEEIFAGCKKAGFREMEVGKELLAPDLKSKTAELLKKYKMRLTSVYAAGPMYEAAMAEKTIAEAIETAEAARELGVKMILSNPNPKPNRGRKSDEELAIQARYVTRFGEELQKRGMKLALHHHNPEMAENAREWRHLLKNVDPKLAGVCIDVDWVIRGGQDAMTMLREAGSRIVSLHLRNSRHGVWTESLDEGDYDYASVAAFLKEIGFQGYLIVELAHEKGMTISRPLVENLRRSREYTEKVFGVR